jgi:hypothetical protein
MIILPADISLPGTGGEKEYYDEFGNRFVDIYKRISINPNNNIGRMDKVAVMSEDPAFGPNIYKESAIGPIEKSYKGIEGPVINFRNYSYSLVDKTTGKYLQSGGYCPCPVDPGIYMCHGYSNELDPEYIGINNEGYKKKSSPVLNDIPYSINMMDNEILSFENIYQLPYSETFGFLSSFFNAWTLGYPIECFIIIDSKRKKFNIPKIKYLNGIDKEAMKNLYIILISEVDVVCNYLFRVLERERAQLLIETFLHPFGSVMKIYNCNRGTSEKFNNYMPGQINDVMKNMRADGLKYIESESLNLLGNMSIGEPIEQALDNCDILY